MPLLLLLIPLLLTAGAQAQTQKNLLLMGDSISAAYGMSLQQGWAARLQVRLQEFGGGWQVINASISGETSAGAAARLPALLEAHRPAVVIIELGGNDGLRGYPIAQLRQNLQQMVLQSRQIGARVLLLGMEIPPNYGARYTQMFRETYSLVSNSLQTALVPFMLEGVATHTELMQEDGIHPRVEAQSLLLDNVWPQLAPLLEDPVDG
ncbi:MAG: arylesterase [Halieaceae bacterium]|nr:arylesterase [Halieaceae bacterium]